MVRIVKCPVTVAQKYIGKKWTLVIIRDLIFGKSRFSEFLKSNPNLSSKVLAERLKEMEIDGLIDKIVTSSSPIQVEYTLTTRGMALNKILYELAQFAADHFPEQVFDEPIKKSMITPTFKRAFKLPVDDIIHDSNQPRITNAPIAGYVE